MSTNPAGRSASEFGLRGLSFDALEWMVGPGKSVQSASTNSPVPDQTTQAAATSSDELPSDLGAFDNIDLGNFAANEGFTIQGAAGGDQSGGAVSGIGDINGDGFADFVIGARTSGPTGGGEAYVIFGNGTSADLDLAALNPANGFTISGSDAGDNLGFAVSSAGDINGDGLNDLIVGARNGDDGGNNAGEAFVIFGGTSLTDVDISNLMPSQGFVIEGGTAGDRAGQSVSSAGDINGDGIADLIIGSPFGESATVIFGREGLDSLDLGNFSELDGFVIDGASRISDSVTVAGDVNGDGFDDLILGAPRGNGSAFVVFGGSNLDDFTLETAPANRAIRITPELGNDELGVSVSAAGDVNGDGIDDFILGARLNDSGANNAGEAYVIFGDTSLADIDLSMLMPSQGFSISGTLAGDQLGRSVSSAGDVNGDGFADLLIGVTGGDAGGNNSGEAIVVFGGLSVSSVDIDNLAANEGFVIAGDRNNDQLGQAASGAGDVNGDGFGDILVGAFGNDAGGRNAGASYIIFGGATGTESTVPVVAAGTMAADNLNGNAGDDTFTGIGTDDVVRSSAGDDSITIAATDFASIDGGLGVDTLGFEGSGLSLDFTAIGNSGLTSIEAFDIRGSGANSITLNQRSVFNLTEVRSGGETTLTIRADADDTVNLSSDFMANGQVMVDGVTFNVFTSGNANVRVEAANTPGTVPVPTPLPVAAPVLEFDDVDATTGIFIQGDTNGDRAGFSVAGIGDVNGDGLDDVLVGAPNGDDGGANAGEAYVIFGGNSLADVDLSNLTPDQGFSIQGDFDGDEAGFSVSAAGDINGDGLQDLIVGARNGDDAGSNAGEAYVIFGRRAFNDIDLTNLSSNLGFTISGADAGDRSGTAISSAGDINGDGIDDLIIGAPNGSETYVVFGGTNPADVDLGNLGSDGFTITGLNQLSRSVSNLGDIDGDGFADLLVSNGRGSAFVLFPMGSGSDIDVSALAPGQGFEITGPAPDNDFGASVSGLGDINGDGLNDFAIGARLNDDGGSNAGASYIIFGAAGLSSVDLTMLTPSQGFQITGDEAGDQSGRAVSDAGDVNGDGFADIILGAPGANGAGRAYVIFGGTNLADIDLNLLEEGQGLIIQGDGNNDQTGFSVASAGDVNGDGFDDLVVGAYRGDDGGSNAGEAIIIFGGATGTEDLTPVNESGTGAVDNFTGNAGDDTFSDITTGDVVRGGAGDDTVTVTSLDFASIDGGRGTDTLALDGAGVTLDLTGRDTDGLSSIEVIDLTGGGNNTLIIDRETIQRLTEERSEGEASLTVRGNAGDSLDLSTGSYRSIGTTTIDGVDFTILDDTETTILVESGVAVTGLLAPVLDVTDLAASDGFIIQGAEANDYASYSLSFAGDINGDGFEDILIGSFYGMGTPPTENDAYVVFGGSGTFGVDVSGRQVIDLSTLAPSDGFVLRAPGSLTTVSGAGDVNGDGIEDFIVGAPGDASYAGTSFVVFGGTGTFGTDDNGRQLVDLASLTASQGFIVQGDTAGDGSGLALSAAGDINGDGIGDIIIGARNGDDGGGGAGEAYVLFGSDGTFGVDVSGQQIINLSSLSASEGFIIQGDAAGDTASYSVASLGDINGDGFEDIIIGAPNGDDYSNQAGEAYIIFGAESGFGSDVGGRQVIDLTTLSASEGFVVQGTYFSSAGGDVSSAGDINGDGFNDVLIGARFANATTSSSGAAYVLFGGSGTFGTDVSGRQVIDLNTLTSAEGIVLGGDGFTFRLGQGVASAGDVNGDGFADIIVGSYVGSTGSETSGDAFVIFGQAGGFGQISGGQQFLDLGTFTPDQGFILRGDEQGDFFGRSVSGGRDVNGDGFDDIVVGARTGDDGGTYAGEAYVIFGGRTGTEDLTPVNLSGTGGVDNFTGNAGDDVFDGIATDDVVRGGAGDDSITAFTQDFALIDGGRGTDTLVLDLAGARVDIRGPGTGGLNSIEEIDISGTGNNTLILDPLTVFNLTEQRASGLTTLVIRGDSGDTVQIDVSGVASSGSTMIGGITFNTFTFGNAVLQVQDGVSVSEVLAPSVSLDSLPTSQGLTFLGEAASDNLGASVSNLGDINGDGFDDFIIGAFDGQYSAVSAGEAYVIFGGAALTNTDLGSLGVSQGFVIQGGLVGDDLSNAVAPAGDINGDGFDDIVIGAYRGDDGGNNAGEAYVIFGNDVGFGSAVGGRQVLDLDSLSASEGFVIEGDRDGDLTGISVAGGGDLDGDGFDDLVIGAAGRDDNGNLSGGAVIIAGQDGVFGTTVNGRQVVTVFRDGQRLIEGDAQDDFAGRSVDIIGDINGDGFDDVLIGADGGDDGGNGAGEAYIVFGNANLIPNNALVRTDLAALGPNDGFIIQGDEPGDELGFTVSRAGDVNGDGIVDLIVGAPDGDNGGARAGEAYVIFGSTGTFGVDVSGRQVIDLTTLSASQGFIIQGDIDGDFLGTSVSFAGDVNGDGFDDLIVGAPLGDNSDGSAGEAYVIFGGAGNLGVDVSGRQVIDVSNLSDQRGFIIEGAGFVNNAGASVSAAGDVNGDGFADLLVGAPGNSQNGTGAGAAYIVFGGATGTEDLVQISETGTANADNFTGNAGDDIFDNISLNDVVSSGAGNDQVSISSSDFANIDGGSGVDTVAFEGANIVLDTASIGNGGIRSIETFDLTGTGANSLTINQNSIFRLTEERSGGDATITIFGDTDDVVEIVGGAFAANGTIDVDGITFNIFTAGNANLRVEDGVSVTLPGAIIDVTTLSASDGFIIQGDGNNEYAGADVSSAGDINGDGIEDFVVTAARSDVGDNNSGDAYVIFGGTGVFGTDVAGRQVIDLGNFASDQGFIIAGARPGDRTGESVSAAGDVNGDGFDDLIVGARYGDTGGTNAGDSFVVFGGNASPGTAVGGQQILDLATLTASEGFVIIGDTSRDFAGTSVSSAGDVNGDGFDDLIIGAFGGDDAASNAGEAYVIFGGLNSFSVDSFGRLAIDLSSLNSAQGFIIQGDGGNDQLGISVSSAGDVNGDGFDDVIVGAHYADDGLPNSGTAYVVFGGSGSFGVDVSGRQVINVASLDASSGFLLQGAGQNDRAGFSVAGLGDVNGDGFDDFAVGVRAGDIGGSAAGETVIVFGTSAGFGTDVSGRQIIDLLSVDPSEGFTIIGADGADQFGIAVSAAGDVNGDGLQDLIVGAPFNDAGGLSAGSAYVVLGSSDGFGSELNGRSIVDVTLLSQTQGFTIQGDAASDRLGYAVSAAGDINGDGFDDLVVGARYGTDGGTNAGEAYIVFGGNTGSESTSPVSESGTSGVDNFTGNAGDDSFGSISTGDVVRGGAGDDVTTVTSLDFASIDGGNGYDEVAFDGAGLSLDLTGALRRSLNSIEAFDLTGSGNNSITLDAQAIFDLTEQRSIAGTTLTVRGDTGDSVDLAGGNFMSVGGAFVDGENFTVYSDGNARVQVQLGVTVVGAAALDVVDLTNLDPARGFIVNDLVLVGDPSVSGINDLNGDGFADIVIGTYADAGFDGVAHIIFGGSDPFGSNEDGRQVFSVYDIEATTGLTVVGADLDFAGFDVATAGDVNGDGFEDVIINAYNSSDGGMYAGSAYVLFGEASPQGNSPLIRLDNLSEDQGFIIQGDAPYDFLESVSSAGDVNGDGFEDLIVGTSRGYDGGARAGEAYVVFGGSGTFGSTVSGRQIIDLGTLTSSQGFIIQGDQAGDNIGYAVSGAGDINGDGFSEVIVGARNGEAYIVFGTDAGFGVDVSGRQVIDLTTLSASEGFIVRGDVGDVLARSVSVAGDINGDGFEDLILGATGANGAYVLFGGDGSFGIDLSGRQVLELANLSASEGFFIAGDAAGDRAGVSVSGAGDVNGDGFNDLIVGASLGDDGGTNAGEAYVIYGGAGPFGVDVAGLQTLDLSALTSSEGFIIQGGIQNDEVGSEVAAAGDVNGDGFDDLIVGADEDAGEAYVIFGGATGTESVVVVSSTGTAGVDNFTGNAGDDTFGAIATDDVVRGGAGDDEITITAVDFADINGGNGTDELVLDGTGLTLDLTGPGNAGVSSIETFDITGSGNNTLILDQQAVFDLTEERSAGAATLIVRGNAGDTVDLQSGFSANGTTMIDGLTFNIFTNGNANVQVQDGVSVIDWAGAQGGLRSLIDAPVADHEDGARSYEGDLAFVDPDNFDDLGILGREDFEPGLLEALSGEVEAPVLDVPDARATPVTVSEDSVFSELSLAPDQDVFDGPVRADETNVQVEAPSLDIVNEATDIILPPEIASRQIQTVEAGSFTELSHAQTETVYWGDLSAVPETGSVLKPLPVGADAVPGLLDLTVKDDTAEQDDTAPAESQDLSAYALELHDGPIIFTPTDEENDPVLLSDLTSVNALIEG